MTATHVAQLAIGRFLHPANEPRMAGFMANLDRVSAIAERGEGFVWRLKDDSGNATAIRAFPDAGMAVNFSVRESVEALQKLVWNTAHARFYNGKWSRPPSIKLWMSRKYG